MRPVEDRPGSTLVRSASRDARVSCETLSHLENFPHKVDVSGDVEKWHEEGDLELEQDAEKKAYEDFKPYRPGRHLFSCFPPRTGLHILPKPFMSPGRHAKRQNDFGGRSRPGVFYSGPLSHSGPIGSIPHSGPLKIGTGSSSSHSTAMKGVSRGHSGPFTMMPADVIGKEKLPGYQSDEPTSPEVTCIGKVRIKHRHWAKAMQEDKRSKRHGMGKWMTKQKGKEKQAETLGREKQSRWHFLGRKEATSASSNEEGTFEIDPKRSSSPDEASLLVEAKGSDGKGLQLLRTEHGRDDEAVEALSLPLPPANSLLLMKGGSRNWDRPNEEGVTPAEAVSFTRDTGIHMKTEKEGERGEMAEMTNAMLRRGGSKSMERQNSLPGSCARKGESIWKRRSMAQPCALDVKRDCTRTEVVKKQPMTR